MAGRGNSESPTPATTLEPSTHMSHSPGSTRQDALSALRRALLFAHCALPRERLETLTAAFETTAYNADQSLGHGYERSLALANRLTDTCAVYPTHDAASDAALEALAGLVRRYRQGADGDRGIRERDAWRAEGAARERDIRWESRRVSDVLRERREADRGGRYDETRRGDEMTRISFGSPFPAAQPGGDEPDSGSAPDSTYLPWLGDTWDVRDTEAARQRMRSEGRRMAVEGGASGSGDSLSGPVGIHNSGAAGRWNRPGISAEEREEEMLQSQLRQQAALRFPERRNFVLFPSGQVPHSDDESILNARASVERVGRAIRHARSGRARIIEPRRASENGIVDELDAIVAAEIVREDLLAHGEGGGPSGEQDLDDLPGTGRRVRWGSEADAALTTARRHARADFETRSELRRTRALWQLTSSHRGQTGFDRAQREIYQRTAHDPLTRPSAYARRPRSAAVPKMIFELTVPAFVEERSVALEYSTIKSEEKIFNEAKWRVNIVVDNSAGTVPSNAESVAGSRAPSGRTASIFLECSLPETAAQSSADDSRWSAGEMKFIVAVTGPEGESEREFCHLFSGVGPSRHDWGGKGFEVGRGEAKVVVTLEVPKTMISEEKVIMKTGREGAGCVCQACKHGNIVEWKALLNCGHSFCTDCADGMVGAGPGQGHGRCGVCDRNATSSMRVFI